MHCNHKCFKRELKDSRYFCQIDVNFTETEGATTKQNMWTWLNDQMSSSVISYPDTPCNFSCNVAHNVAEVQSSSTFVMLRATNCMVTPKKSCCRQKCTLLTKYREHNIIKEVMLRKLASKKFIIGLLHCLYSGVLLSFKKSES